MPHVKFRAWDKKKNAWFDDEDGELYIELNGNINFGWNGEISEEQFISEIRVSHGNYKHNQRKIYNSEG